MGQFLCCYQIIVCVCDSLVPCKELSIIDKEVKLRKLGLCASFNLQLP